MKNYQWILFDADETLFHFDAFSGLKIMFSQFGINFNEQDYEEYETVNQPLWTDYQNGIINSEQLQTMRFDAWGKKLQVDPHVLNTGFMVAMAEICKPIEGAIDLLNTLKGKVKLGIVTNGFTELQQARLEHTGLKDHFDLLVISEQVGIAKPNPGIFEHAFQQMGNPDRKNILMVGDNPASDILGGINAGIDTCWFNWKNKPDPKGIVPNYKISALGELKLYLSWI